MLYGGNRTIISLLLVIFLVSCGPIQTDTSSSLKQPKSTQKNNSKMGFHSIPSASFVMPNISFNVTTQDNVTLQIDAQDGISCYYSNLESFAPFELGINRVTGYTNDDVQQIKAKFTRWYERKPNYSLTPVPPPPLFLPDTIQIISPSIGMGFTHAYGPAQCQGEIDITNTSQTPVQIQFFDMRLISVPQIDNRSYNYIDICSLLPPSANPTYSPPDPNVPAPCPQQRAGGGQSQYNFSLDTEQIGHVFYPQAAQGFPQPTSFTLTPDNPERLTFDFDSMPPNATYSLVPELAINGSDGLQTLELQQLKATLAFVNLSQITCYTLQRNAFVPTDKGWCV